MIVAVASPPHPSHRTAERLVPASDVRTWRTPREGDLGLRAISNAAGLHVSIVPNGSLFAIEHRSARGSVLVNQVLASPIEAGIGGVVLRCGGARPSTIDAVGAMVSVGGAHDRFVWAGDTRDVRHRVTLRLLGGQSAWLWRVEVTNSGNAVLPIDAILRQDLGLGGLGFVANNEAYASQYIDHHVARHPRYGPVVMSRQNLAQDGAHPWLMQGCIEGTVAFATDALQLFGPAHRDGNGFALGFETPLPARRLQHEAACVALQSPAATLEPGATATWQFFAVYVPDHADASGEGDLARLDSLSWNDAGAAAEARPVLRKVLQPAVIAETRALHRDEISKRYPDCLLQELEGGELRSFFTPDAPHNRHVVLRGKELAITRRHGAVLRSGSALLPDDSTLSVTCWMHGVFAAQLTIGNTSFHKLFSVSRDPYNVTRTSGLRVWIEVDDAWRLLGVPSAFEMGLADCRWIYAMSNRVVTVHATVSGGDPAMQWRVSVEGEACRLLVTGHLVLGERELAHRGVVTVDAAKRRFTFQPDPDSRWGEHYPDAVYHLVTSTPEVIEAVGGDELLHVDESGATGSHVVIRSVPTRALCFAVTGSLNDAAEAARLARRYEQPIDDAALMAGAKRFWTHVTRGYRITGDDEDAAALDASLPWLAHDAMIHLTVPRGLEQYTAAAWGTRDVCQGPVELLLTLEHDEPVRDILRIVFARQYASRGDWPQWFMLEPYGAIHDPHSHGDVIVWPLKALNDYVEATNDLAFLDESVAWWDDERLQRTASADSVAAHVDKLLATVRARFIPGTHLIHYGEGDWNDSLQPADPRLRDVMVSSWTVALLYQQIVRYAHILRRAGRRDAELVELAHAMRGDFNRFLVRDGTVAGYAIFEPGRDTPELVIHPSDVRTGLAYSLLPMTRSILAGLFTPQQARHHLRIIREHLLFPDGARLIDRPVAYHGGIERTFRRAESAAFFGREIGLMYTHAHLRYAEAMAVLGEADALWDALHVANPVSVTQRVRNAAARQRNAYFSSSDAAFDDRYAASEAWPRVKDATIEVEGGWRVYSSGPGLYMNVLIRHALGIRRAFGERIEAPVVEGMRRHTPPKLTRAS
jgi:cellobiose phosphorylase